ETRMLGQPSFDFGVLVSGVIVGDEMDVESGRRLVIDGLEKGQPLLVAVTLGDAGDQFTVEVVQRGEQGERPVAEVVVGLGLDVADPQGQTRLGALERLALRFLIAAEDQSFLRRIEIEPDHIPELLLKLLVLGQLEGARQMRLDVVGRPQALDGGFRHAGPAGHGPAAPSPQRGGRRHHFVPNHAHPLQCHPRPPPSAWRATEGLRRRLAPSSNRASRLARNRWPKRLTVPRDTPTRAAIWCCDIPAALRTTISARCRSRTATVVALIRRSNSPRSSPLNTILLRVTASPNCSARSMSKDTMPCQAISETLH